MDRNRCFTIGLLALLACAWFSAVAVADDGAPGALSPGVQGITAAALRGHVYFLAGDALGGRAVASRGYEVAAQYAASQFEAAGLVPLDSLDARGPFYQEVPMARRTVTGTLQFAVTTRRGERLFAEGPDIKWFQGDISPLERGPIPVVYIGYGICEPALGWDDLQGLDVRGKIVALLMGAPAEGKVPAAVAERYGSPSSIFRKMTSLVSKGIAGIIVLPDPELTAAWEQLRSKTGAPSVEYASSDPSALQVGGLLLAKPDFATALFAGQRRVPPGLGLPGKTTARGFALDGVTMTVRGAIASEPVPAWNVIGVVPGTDPAVKSEHVVVCAHLDSSTPAAAGEVYNGADDDASGCAGVLEIAKVVAAHPLRRSVIFALFTGEEAALAGSRHFVSRGPVPVERIVAVVDLDMIGRTDEASQGDRAHYAIDSGRVTPELTRLIREVNARTVNWPLKFENASGNSDNLAFDFRGIPGVSFYSGHHPDVNRPTDDPQKLDYGKAEQIARLACEITTALGSELLPWW